MEEISENWDGKHVRPLPVKLTVGTGGFLVDLCIAWPFIFCAFSFTLYFAIHPNSRDRVYGYRQIPTLSQTGMLVPESLFFTYGLHLEGALLALLFTFLFAHFKNKISAIDSKLEPFLPDKHNHVEEDALVESENDTPQIHHTSTTTCSKGMYFLCCCCCMPKQSCKVDVPFLNFWNRLLWYLGLSCSLLMSLVGTVSLSVNTDAHGIIAFFMYLTALLHMILYYYTIADAMGYTVMQLNIHRACLFVCYPFNIFMFIMILVMYNTCNNDPCMESAVNLIVTLEYTTTLALLAYVYRFRGDLQDINLMALSKALVEEKDMIVENIANVRRNYSGSNDNTTDASREGTSSQNNDSMYGIDGVKYGNRNVEQDHTKAIVDLLI